MTVTREERERELWEMARSPEGMLELERLHCDRTGEASGIERNHETADVGPMIVRVLDDEYFNGQQPA